MTTIKPIYSEKDQSSIDKYYAQLSEYEKMFISRCNLDGMDDQQMQNKLLSDNFRNSMIKDIAFFISMIIPSYEVKI